MHVRGCTQKSSVKHAETKTAHRSLFNIPQRKFLIVQHAVVATYEAVSPLEDSERQTELIKRT